VVQQVQDLLEVLQQVVPLVLRLALGPLSQTVALFVQVVSLSLQALEIVPEIEVLRHMRP
jgi:hypothetical protein